MMQRVFGVLAALAMVSVPVACSSSSGGGVTPVTDSGKADTKVGGDAADTGAKPDGETGVQCGVTADCTTGKPCAINDDCDKTGNGLTHCTASGYYSLGPLSPTPSCTGADQAGDYPECASVTVDANGYPSEFAFCDGNTGLCNEQPTNKVKGTWYCEPLCQTDATGKYTTACTGKNACSPIGTGSDSSGNFSGAVGTCFGGCSTNADCPTGSVCDPVDKICTNVKCTADAACTTAWKTAPASWKCDTSTGNPTSGFCKFTYAKNPGDTCNPAATTDECLCLAKTGDTTGYCSAACKVGSDATDCATGYTCDPLWNAADSTGKPTFPTGFAWAAGTSGYCAKKCAADTDCITGQKCEAHGGIAQKTCL